MNGRDFDPDATCDDVDELLTFRAGAVGRGNLPDFVIVESAPLIGTDDNGGLVTTP